MDLEEDSSSTSTGQKWLIAIALGVVYLLLNNPVTYAFLGALSTLLGGMRLYPGDFILSIILALLFVLIVRVFLW